MCTLARVRGSAHKSVKNPEQGRKLKGAKEMARYSEQELDQLKRSIDLVALIQSKGIKLEKHGKDMKGLCPFHADKSPSMIITPGKNLFHCPACATGGDVIAFIQKFDGVSFRHVALARLPSTTRGTVCSSTRSLSRRKLLLSRRLVLSFHKRRVMLMESC